MAWAGGGSWPWSWFAPFLGLFEVFIPKRPDVFKYQLRATYPGGEVRQYWDPYCFLPALGPQDLYLFNEGNEHRIYTKLGAHPRVLGGVPGVSFAVWAPAATRVSVVGNFNHWDGRIHPMRSLGQSGVWELFIPNIGDGTTYKWKPNYSFDYAESFLNQRFGVLLSASHAHSYTEQYVVNNGYNRSPTAADPRPMVVRQMIIVGRVAEALARAIAASTAATS